MDYDSNKDAGTRSHFTYLRKEGHLLINRETIELTIQNLKYIYNCPTS